MPESCEFTLTLTRGPCKLIFLTSKPKTYLVPERERTDPPPRSILATIRTVILFKDRDIINKCGLDAYFFLRYLKTLIIIFIPICVVVLPILIPLNYIDGRGTNIVYGSDDTSSLKRRDEPEVKNNITGLDTIAWGNVKPINSSRYTAHLIMAILTVIWVCSVFFFEFKAYIKVRQDYLTSAEHRLRASATTVLVSGIPYKWLSEEGLIGLFDVFPGGVRNVWLNRDFSKLLDKINLRDSIHNKLENAETQLIKSAKKAELKQTYAKEKAERKKNNLQPLTRKEKAAIKAQRDKDAEILARSDEGHEEGDESKIPHNVSEGVRESEREVESRAAHEKPHTPVANVQMNLQPDIPADVFSALSPREEAAESERAPSQAGSAVSVESTSAIQKPSAERRANGNTVRKLEDEQELYSTEEPKFWQFWKPPSGGYASPVPQGLEQATELHDMYADKTFWQQMKVYIPFMGSEEPSVEYAEAFSMSEDQMKARDAAWKKYLKAKHRPTHHLGLFGINWLFGIPGITKKVDTIYWCRKELARLNVEIEEDQKHPERYPPLNSAFVQFNHQIAAHMACQSTIHHIPRQMAPRTIEISPRDVVWGNMAMTWWQQWLRTGIIAVVVTGMTILWAIPVAWTAAINNVESLTKIDAFKFLSKTKTTRNVASAIAGVLPTLVIAIILAIVPLIMELLAGIKGVKTGSQRTEFVQRWFFAFLFVQLFLVVSIASFFTNSLEKLVYNLSQLKDVNYVLKDVLATNLPSAANYFFSYMILQALSTSSATLLQLISLIFWYIIGPIFDSTARSKWKRNTSLNNVIWGSFFPIYTNFACIGLIYCVIAPLISIFAVITFGLLWVAQRYAMIYIYRFTEDTGGVLYPRAIHQAFTGLYVMELAMAGLFLIVRNQDDKFVCIPHGVIMLVVFVLTAAYQYLLHTSFAPLCRYLPVTLEDEAVLRDEAFERAQNRRLGLVNVEDDECADEATGLSSEAKKPHTNGEEGEEYELMDYHKHATFALKPVKQVGTWAKAGTKQVGGWAREGGKELMKLTFLDGQSKAAAEYRRAQRKKDLEAQRAMGEALYGDVHDEVEDLTPKERDMLVKHAFMHYALRARRPVVWIPQDGNGVSDDEIRETKEFSDHIWVSNEGTALDSKQRVVYGRSPPDFSEVDVIKL